MAIYIINSFIRSFWNPCQTYPSDWICFIYMGPYKIGMHMWLQNAKWACICIHTLLSRPHIVSHNVKLITFSNPYVVWLCRVTACGQCNVIKWLHLHMWGRSCSLMHCIFWNMVRKHWMKCVLTKYTVSKCGCIHI